MAKGSKKKTSPSPAKTNNSTTSDIDDGTADLEDNSPITKNDLHNALKLHLNPTIDKLQAQLDAVALIAENALKLAEQMEIRLKKSEEAQLALKAENNELKYKLKMNSNHIKLIEERIEERTNRQLRKTLVFRGIPEKSSEGAEPGQPETWAETEAILAKEIAKHCKLPEDVASGLVSVPIDLLPTCATREPALAQYLPPFTFGKKVNFVRKSLKKRTLPRRPASPVTRNVVH